MADPLLLVTVVLIAALAYLNGLHDASNAISTSIATRTLRESTALRYAAVLNLLGGFIGLGLAALTGGAAARVLHLPDPSTVTDPALARTLLLALASGVGAAFTWGVVTWWIGMPSSTWQALAGGLGGSLLGVGLAADWSTRLLPLVAPALLTPLLGAAVAFLAVQGLARLAAWDRVRTDHLRFAQTVSAGSVAVGHGVRDVLIPASALVLAVGLYERSGATTVTDGALLLGIGLPASAVLIAAGTLTGGHRIIRTLGRRLTQLTTVQGLAAEAATAVLLAGVLIAPTAPISLSQTLACGVVGAGLATGRRAVRWRIVGRMVLVWVVTPPMCALLGLVATRIVVNSVGIS
ncbi:inorganic phosphate transporter [Brachybacterium sp. EF45031]|uniref:inorganic phosphate transporter n=1 Tax=Brachybacterium sillae TaxID=2810536 RepID=UPI00217DD04B|nr:inorganic phosphate transporter [Brachybacterium sillae]MCS6711458.1 inorganic phosphate transporter [Brachybacterium sillae]